MIPLELKPLKPYLADLQERDLKRKFKAYHLIPSPSLFYVLAKIGEPIDALTPSSWISTILRHFFLYFRFTRLFAKIGLSNSNGKIRYKTILRDKFGTTETTDTDNSK